MNAQIPPIGSLRDRVQLQRKNMVPEAEGGHSIVFTPLASVWARVHARTAHFNEQANARATKGTHSVVTRFRTDLAPGDRIVYRGLAFEVLSANDLNGRKAYLTCNCIETRVVG